MTNSFGMHAEIWDKRSYFLSNVNSINIEGYEIRNCLKNHENSYRLVLREEQFESQYQKRRKLYQFSNFCKRERRHARKVTMNLSFVWDK